MGQKQHSDEQKRNHPRADLDLLEIAAETADDDVGNETKGNAKGDIVGKGHNCQRKECGHTDLEIGPVSFLYWPYYSMFITFFHYESYQFQTNLFFIGQ